MVCFVKGVVAEEEKRSQPRLGIEYECNQWVNWIYTEESPSFFPFGGWVGRYGKDGIF
jgi:hypothetical protein